MAELGAPRPGDGLRIGAILADWIEETAWMVPVHDRAETLGFGDLLIRVSDVTVARLAQRVVGFLSRQDDEVQALYVVASVRGGGIGGALLERAKAAAPRLALWTFQANVDAQRFYHRHGFVEMARSDGQGNDEKLPDVRLVWQRGQT
jgi:GNAT superfamily N-acetyltransferase